MKANLTNSISSSSRVLQSFSRKNQQVRFSDNRNTKTTQLIRVIQRASHIKNVSGLSPTASPTFAVSNRPVIVFESMASNVADLQAVYNESLHHQGNTICILGLNCKTTAATNFDTATQALNAWITGLNNQGQHYAYAFTFKWDSIGNAVDYSLPFVEARYTVMNKAKAKVATINGNNKYLYRWFDGDARESYSLSTATLTTMADEDAPMVMSGTYRWRPARIIVNNTSVEYRNYALFLNRINFFENRLRSYYFKLCNPMPLTTEIGSGYYPETTLLMNQRAHDYALAKKNGQTIEETASSTDSLQDKESLKFITHIGARPTHQPAMNPTKPIKNENDDKTYLGANLRNWIIIDTASRSSVGLIAGLKTLRQSAFDNTKWNFKTDQTWDAWENANKVNTQDIDYDTKNKQELINKMRRVYSSLLFNEFKGQPMQLNG